MTRLLRIDELSWPAYNDLIRQKPVIVPIGAVEQHGHHLPLGTDAMHVTAVAERAARQSDSLLAPTVSYGYKSIPRSGGGEGFPGTISLNGATLVSLVQDVVTQLVDDGAERIMLLSGHFENAVMLHEGADLALRGQREGSARVINAMWGDSIPQHVLSACYPGNFTGFQLEHAAFLETSIMLHLRPDLVHLELAGTQVADMRLFVPAVGVGERLGMTRSG